MSEEISREEIAALLARESEEMTREEAIEELSILLNKYQDGRFGDAIDMAMTALEQEPCDDAISRQAAIDAIRKDVMGGLNYEGILTRLPSVTQKQEPCDNCEVGNPCIYCKHEFEPQESEEQS